MPVTRSQRDAPIGVGSTPSSSEHTDSERVTPESRTTTTTEGTTGTTTTGAAGTAASEATATTASLRTVEAVRKEAASKKVTSEHKSIEDEPGQGTRSAAMTIVPVSSNRRARSTKTTSSSARRRELAAREEMARLELERAQAASKLASIRLELAQQDSEEDDSIDDEEEADRAAQVQNWIQTSIMKEKNREQNEKRGQRPTEDQQGVKKEESKHSGDIRALADAIKEAVSVGRGPASQPKYIHELPFYDGSSREWLAFKVVYEDTAPMFTSAQNMARLRTAVKGNAREAIKSLLFSEAAPEEVMDALRRRYGRPDALVLAELDKVKALPRLTDNPRDICVFASQVSNSVATIKGLKKPQYLHSPEMVKQIVEKMPSILRFRWYDYTAGNEGSELPNLVLISRFLNEEADKCGAFATLEDKQGFRRPPRFTAHVTNNEQSNKKVCPACQGNHYLLECFQFKKSSVQDRWAIVKKVRVCFKCLQGRHRKESCRRPPCKICRRWHHPLLHVDAGQYQKIREEEVKTEAQREVATNVTAPVNAVKEARAYLKMIPVEVYGPKGSTQVMALLDEGSTISLIDASVAERVGATGEEDKLVIETVGGKLIRKNNSQKLNLAIRGIHRDKKSRITQVRTIDNLKLTPQHLDRRKIEECSHLKKIASSLYYEASSPQLLIGQDNWQLIVSRSIRKGKPGLPVASRTELGWVLHGYDSRNARPVNFLDSCHHIVTTEELHQEIKEHFAIEALGVQPRRPTTDAEGRALAVLERTCKRTENGRFEAGLLWKNDEIKMPESYASAVNRLRNIERKLDKDPDLKEEYSKQIQHLIESKYAEEAPGPATSVRKWYLPHFPVTHPVKKKIRIVFDAAAKSGGKSLNDVLLPGPDLLQSLFGVLVRFRQGPIAVAADIKEMFLQIKIREEDRDSLRFLWRGDNRKETAKEYRMSSVVFGATSSPSTAIYVKNKNAKEYQTQYPEAAKAIEVNHYMDDYLQSFHSEEQFKKVTSEVDLIHRQASFELRGWASNRPELFLKKQDEIKTEVRLGEKEEKTLGLRWYTESDSIGFRAELRNTPEEVLQGFRTPTKREVTSAVMSTFDPLGLASPVLVQGKKLIQRIWRSGVGWDEEIEAAEHDGWTAYMEHTKLLQNLQIPRCIAPQRTEGELHVFSDASETAYAAAVYWRTEDEGNNIRVSLLAAKARVTPLKPVSIPRLELQAALLGTRLAQSIESELQLKVSKKIYWTDSSIVLSWIKTDPRTFKTFVAHRLAEIEDTTKPQDWRWVPSAQNPADDATRKVPEDFTHEHRWFTGPAFLKKPESEWPAPRSFKKETTGEEKASDIVMAISRQQPVINHEKFSSWKRLWRTTARVFQFIEKCKPKKKANACRRQDDPTWKKHMKAKAPIKSQKVRKPDTKEIYPPIGAEILKKAEETLLKQSQEESFKDDLQRLRQTKTLENSSKLKKLDVVLEDGLLHLKGRIDAIRGLSREYKRPIVLDSRNHITQLIIEDYHQRFNHGNHATVMNELRQRFWILGLRAAVKKVQHQCQWCKINKSMPKEIPLGNLPEERLRHGSPPFTCTGVDYFGPMSVTVARRHEKRWGALFTCLTTRAVHIELAPSLSTDSMLMALRRFAARRGMPSTVYSDNGTNFVGANNELLEAIASMKNQDMEIEAEKLGVQWKFIPPGAPNMGGAWERLVRSIKTALHATLKEKHPREEVLHTLLLEAEHVVNSRPLTHLAENLEEEALTPNHFLIGRSCGAARIGTFEDADLIGRDTWRTAQRLADHFWRRWVREYLPTLLPRRMKTSSHGDELNIGDVVLIVDSNLPRCTWPRGRILQTYTGPDGRTRIIDVETRGGVLRRPSSRIVPLVRASPSPEDGATHEGENCRRSNEV